MFDSVRAQTGQPSAGPEMPTEAEHSMFVKGQTLYTHGLYGEAIVILSESLESFPNSSIKDLNLLWLGRSYLAQGDITNAEKTELRLRSIPDTPLLGIYEEELRRARQDYAKVAPSPVLKREPVNKPDRSMSLETYKSHNAPPSLRPIADSPANKRLVKELNVSGSSKNFPASMLRTVRFPTGWSSRMKEKERRKI